MLPRQVEQRLVAEPEVDVDVDANEGPQRSWPQPERRKRHYLYSSRFLPAPVKECP